MGFRFQKRVSIFPGLRLNLSKRGASLSVGTRGAWFTIGSRGTRATVGIPGTGLSWTENSKSARRSRKSTVQQQIPVGTVIRVPPDQVDAVRQTLKTQGYETAIQGQEHEALEQIPQAEMSSKMFKRLCTAGFLVAFYIVWQLAH